METHLPFCMLCGVKLVLGADGAPDQAQGLPEAGMASAPNGATLRSAGRRSQVGDRRRRRVAGHEVLVSADADVRFQWC